MSDIDTEAVDSLKVLDPNRPIREADIMHFFNGPMVHFYRNVFSHVPAGKLRARWR